MGKSTTNLDFFQEKNINNSKVNTYDPSMPTSSVDIPISENSQTININSNILLILNRC